MTERAALMLVASLLAGAAVHFALGRASRRLPRALARRRGAVPAGHVPTPRPLALAVVALQTLAWTAALWLATQPFPALREARGAAVELVAQSLAAPLFTLDQRSFTTREVLVLPMLVVLVWVAASGLTRLFRSRVLEAAGVEPGAQEALSTLLRYGASLVGTVVVLQAWGVDLRSFAILASVLGVGIGFGLQNIANNFVSGVLINAERPVRPGDFVRVGEFVGSVTRVGARSTSIRTLDRVTILVPNSRLLESEVVNWSHDDPTTRVHVPVGVAYGSDLFRVRHALLEVARGHRGVLRDPRPEVQLVRFGGSSLDFELLVFTADPRSQFRLVSDLNVRIVSALRAAGIQIPFPQLDLHLRPSPTVGPETDAEHAAADLAELGPEEWSEAELAAVAEKMRGPMGVPIADRRHLLSVYRRCFVGSEAVDWLVDHAGLTRGEAVALGQRLVDLGRFRHVLGEHGFRDGNFFFRFREDEPEEVRRVAS